ncbi:ABC transporter substrate-binding protein [Thalassobaculum sp.]|uniref:ABC transporter substrate-binding protein n=1 Tax=Thalassobaculum sp. TaxID=2022740 RepID=UPI0032EDA33F
MRLLTTLLACAMLLITSPTRAADKLTVLLDWFVNPDHGPLIVAQELGLYGQQGLEVELIAPADPNDPPKLVAAGKAEIAVSYQPQLHLQVAEGLPLVRFGTLVATPLNTLTVLADGPIKSLADLKGRKIGFSVAGTEEATLNAMLRTVGLTTADVELVNVNFSLSPSLISGQVDAVIGAYRNFELNQMDIVGRPGRAFYVEEHGVPPFDQLIYVTHRDLSSDPRLARFLDATERAVQFMVNHPDKAWALFVKNHPEVDDELNRRAWRDTLPRFALRPAALDVRRYERMATFLKDAGLVKSTPPVESYAITVR